MRIELELRRELFDQVDEGLWRLRWHGSHWRRWRWRGEGHDDGCGRRLGRRRLRGRCRRLHAGWLGLGHRADLLHQALRSGVTLCGGGGKEVGGNGIVARHAAAIGVHPAQVELRHRITQARSLAVQQRRPCQITRHALALLVGAGFGTQLSDALGVCAVLCQRQGSPGQSPCQRGALRQAQRALVQLG